MKITKLTTYHLAPRWLFLKIETDEGVTGWGEPVIEGRARTVEAAVGDFSGYLIGKGPSRFHDGYMLPPKKPGLGVDVDEELVIERSKTAPDWRNPVWRHADGAVAEW
jgi:L-alanine-DL-glutamate epimerase-like enolase superfamily enzyme